MSRTLAFIACALLATACSSNDSTSTSDSPTRTVEVEMRDLAFDPTTVAVEAGETVRFVFVNVGAVVHEAYLGDTAAQADHASEMAEMSGMDHGDDNVLIVDPGERGEMTHTFERSETLQLGCHQPGHFEAGMVLDVDVK